MIKRAIRWIAEVVLWLGIFLGLFVLAMGISLAWMRQARAEEIYHLPAAHQKRPMAATMGGDVPRSN